jgi:hypothetical protein
VSISSNVSGSTGDGSQRRTVLIADQGHGFDFEKYLELDESRLLYNHGRGIVMTNLCLDLQYLGTGNEVVVTIPLE